MQGALSMLIQNRRLAFLLVGLLVLGCGQSALPVDQDIPTYQVRILNVFPHDSGAFTQGLVVEGTTIYESTGQYGNSTLRQVDLESGRVEKRLPLDPKYFAEGIGIVGDWIYQLTWKERVCFVYDKTTFKALGALQYSGQGWGLTHDDEVVYMSDGTSTIRVLDPQTFKVLRRIRVKQGRRYLDKLNELEFVDGMILANVWYSDRIAQIDPKSGQVTAWIDCSGVYPASARANREQVMNGIAHDKASGRLFITGKNWPHLYEIEVVR